MLYLRYDPPMDPDDLPEPAGTADEIYHILTLGQDTPEDEEEDE